MYVSLAEINSQSIIYIYLKSENEKTKKKKTKTTITLQSASSSHFFPRVILCVLSAPPLSDGLCRGQTESPAAGRLQTIVSIPLFCALPTWQHLCSASPFVSAWLLSQSPPSCKQERNKEERKKACSLIHSHARVHAKPAGEHAIQHSKKAHTLLPSMLHKCSPAISFRFHCASMSLVLFCFLPLFHTLVIILPSPFLLVRFSKPHVSASPVNPPPPPKTHTHTLQSVSYICESVRDRKRECNECMHVCVFVCVWLW